MNRAFSRRALPAVLAAALAGCAATTPNTVYLRPVIPQRLLDCPDRPAPPAPAARQREVALFLIDLDRAHGLCRERLHALAGLLRRDPPPEPAPATAPEHRP